MTLWVMGFYLRINIGGTPPYFKQVTLYRCSPGAILEAALLDTL